MSNYLFISDAAKEVKVESHVLRYWEEELHLPIKRNELGHRYYTEEDVERFKQIKSMKERGLQLKAIKMILKDGKLDVLSTGETGMNGRIGENTAGAAAETGGRGSQTRMPEVGGRVPQRKAPEMEERVPQRKIPEMEGWVPPSRMPDLESRVPQRRPPEMSMSYGRAAGTGTSEVREPQAGMAIDIISTRQNFPAGEKESAVQETKEDKSRRLQWLLQQLIRQTLQENNMELCREIRNSVVKELDYQFRMQEERDEARDRMLAEQNEEHFKRMDELLRKKSRGLKKRRWDREQEENWEKKNREKRIWNRNQDGNQDKNREGNQEKSQDKNQEKSQDRNQERNQDRNQEWNQNGSQEGNQERNQDKSQEWNQEKNQDSSREWNQDGNQEKNQNRSQEWNQDKNQDGSQEWNQEENREGIQDKNQNYNGDQDKDNAEGNYDGQAVSAKKKKRRFF